MAKEEKHLGTILVGKLLEGFFFCVGVAIAFFIFLILADLIDIPRV